MVMKSGFVNFDQGKSNWTDVMFARWRKHWMSKLVPVDKEDIPNIFNGDRSYYTGLVTSELRR